MTPDDLLAHVAADPQALPRYFAAAGRVARAGSDEPQDVWSVSPADALRLAMLRAVPAPWSRLEDLYRYGDGPERRAVLRALDGLAHPDTNVVRMLIADALRSNDARLVAAALTPSGLDNLDDAALGQAVLKVAFMDLDVSRIPGISERMTSAVARQLMSLVLERVAAGRTVPLGIWMICSGHPDPATEAALRTEVDSTVPARRDAAARALRELQESRR